MEQLKGMSVAALVGMVRHTNEPVEFGKALLEFIGRELSEAVKDEMAERNERNKRIAKDAKVLMIGFEE